MIQAPQSLSVVIPAFNAGGHIRQCLEALTTGSRLATEIVVVDDGSDDDTMQIARSFGVKVSSSGKRSGPAFARNAGVRIATGDIVLFLDADVCVQRDTLAKICAWFEGDDVPDAVIGSYDSTPHCQEFLSQYRNLMHFYVHQTGAEQASTFWSGCGAMSRKLFLQHGGFDEKQFGRPAVEDIELGYRLMQSGCRIVLDRDIQVTHRKRWTFWNLIKTDIMDRGIPWTELILRERFMPNDLNLHISQRVSVALVFILLALSCVAAVYWGGYFLVPLFAVMFALLARWWVEFATPRKPRLASVLLFVTVGVMCVLAWSQHMLAIIPPLTTTPVLLLVGHRYAHTGKRRPLLRWCGFAYTCFSIAAAMAYLPSHPLILLCFGLLAILGLLNSQFYIFLAGKRGIPFMLAAIPFHLLYHFYNGISFIGGSVSFWLERITGRVRGRRTGISPASDV